MTLRRLPDSMQSKRRVPCKDPEHDPPKRVDPSLEPGSYIHTCPTCKNEVPIEVFPAPLDGGELL